MQYDICCTPLNQSIYRCFCTLAIIFLKLLFKYKYFIELRFNSWQYYFADKQVFYLTIFRLNITFHQFRALNIYLCRNVSNEAKLVTCYSLHFTRYLLLFTRYSLLLTGYSLHFTRYLLLFTRYFLIVTRCYLHVTCCYLFVLITFYSCRTALYSQCSH